MSSAIDAKVDAPILHAERQRAVLAAPYAPIGMRLRPELAAWLRCVRAVAASRYARQSMPVAPRQRALNRTYVGGRGSCSLQPAAARFRMRVGVRNIRLDVENGCAVEQVHVAAHAGSIRPRDPAAAPTGPADSAGAASGWRARPCARWCCAVAALWVASRRLRSNQKITQMRSQFARSSMACSRLCPGNSSTTPVMSRAAARLAWRLDPAWHGPCACSLWVRNQSVDSTVFMANVACMLSARDCESTADQVRSTEGPLLTAYRAIRRAYRAGGGLCGCASAAGAAGLCAEGVPQRAGDDVAAVGSAVRGAVADAALAVAVHPAHAVPHRGLGCRSAAGALRSLDGFLLSACQWPGCSGRRQHRARCWFRIWLAVGMLQALRFIGATATGRRGRRPARRLGDPEGQLPSGVTWAQYLHQVQIWWAGNWLGHIAVAPVDLLLADPLRRRPVRAGS